jgi:glycosyltransferase involved in cell wall biosynthesis
LPAIPHTGLHPRPRRGPTRDIAIYAPAAAALYERRPRPTGGAERQTALLAAGLVDSGLRVAHIVLPVEDPEPALPAGLALVQRRLVTSGRAPRDRAAQLVQVWSALAEADAAVYVVRSGLPVLGVAALFCRVRRRRLVFATANDLDLTFGFYDGRRPERLLYALGVRWADAVVVQSGRQRALAARTFPGLRRVVELPSFAAAAPPAPGPPEAFLWVGRLDRHKQPLRYVALAEALPDARFWMIARPLEPERGGGSPGGPSDEAMEREVRERAARLPNLELLEPRPHREAMQLVDRAVAVVGTGAAEGMPNLFLEAWARGVPVLTYEFDPDGRIAREGLGAAADGSAARFAAAARVLWDGRDDRVGLAERLRAHVAATHGVEAVTSRWLQLLSDVGGR